VQLSSRGREEENIKGIGIKLGGGERFQRIETLEVGGTSLSDDREQGTQGKSAA